MKHFRKCCYRAAKRMHYRNHRELTYFQVTTYAQFREDSMEIKLLKSSKERFLGYLHQTTYTVHTIFLLFITPPFFVHGDWILIGL
jgi:hypothetical protein